MRIISYIILCHSISYHIIILIFIRLHKTVAIHCYLYHIISYRIVSFRIVSYCFISYHIVSYRIISYIISHSYHIIMLLFVRLPKRVAIHCYSVCRHLYRNVLCNSLAIVKNTIKQFR